MQGPEDAQAAMTMGNSVQAWTKFYDKHFRQRECQAGIDTMHTWRNQLLAKQTAQVLVPPLQIEEEESSEDEEEEESSEDEEGEVNVIDDNDTESIDESL